MDKLESLSSTLQNITLYDIKSMYNQAKNVVLNISEMEAKVREATNDDPWGASSTLMQEIAQGQYFNEIMPSIYSRFMEKEARQWRQIYKALQLLEYLIKHGSERVVDDARSHISTLKMLRNFHYIDDKGKDEGINVRNRSRELVELLSDVEKIRAERRKAKANKNKYVGVGNDGMSFESSGGGRYGGFGSDSLGGGGGSSTYGNYSNDYRAGGSSSRADMGGSSSYGGSSRRNFEEYNAGDDEVSHTPSPVRTSSVRTPVRKNTAPPPPPPPAPVADLLGGLDDDTFGAPVPAPAPLAMNKALPAVSNPSVGLDDDDFNDFQAAPIQAAPIQAASTPIAPAATKKPTLMDMLNSTSPPIQQQQQPVNTGFAQPSTGFGMGMGMNMGINPGMGMGMAGGAPAGMGGMNMGMGGHRQTPSYSQPGQFSAPMAPTPMAPMKSTPSGFSPGSSMSPKPAGGAAAPAKSANFDDLWSLSLGSTTTSKPAAGTGKSIKDLEKEKAMAGLWGGQQQSGQAKPVGSAPLPAFGGFGTAAPPSSAGNDDLLL
ncbi:ENTH domain-containing protein [Psilocybe cubensis]|uniref:ENTH domain-containing protein n=2 Tax=Psilocybe cubensis TaxID=181762 RepID=A0ACB8GZJ3_PSICU|nr:ENTH domain-containing protein [Psilocybe cubensis]KAH9480380.1 ENTH domain-containing protein [Psilocybe cubensis]